MRPAETLLLELGITDPKDIDVDVIADCVGAEIDYRDLASCEAQIIGYRDRAVIYVRKDTRYQRRRFSAGHELGHWYHHRGQSFVCRPEDIGRPIDEASKNAERVADAYAADLLLPPFLFAPRLSSQQKVTLEGLVALADEFSTSLTATAIRAMRLTKDPVIVVAHNLLGKRWQWPSGTTLGLAVRPDVDPRSSAFASMLGAGRLAPAKREPAGYWFDRRHIDQFELLVQTVKTAEGEALSLVRIVDPKLIEIYG
ncbi:MAG: ImmA/IrrE family metallo-endopeptidase [Micropepsaceae bacterium]